MTIVRIRDAELAAGAQQVLKARRVLWRGNDEDLPDTRQHESGRRVVDHGFVVDGEELLGCDHGERVESGARAASLTYFYDDRLKHFDYANDQSHIILV